MLNKKTLRFFLLAAITVFTFAVVCYYADSQKGVQVKRISTEIQRSLSGLNKRMIKVENLLDHIDTNKQNLWPKLERTVNEGQLLALVYQNDHLIFWNNNIIPNDIHYLDFRNKNIYQNQSTWYLVVNKEYNDFNIYLFKNVFRCVHHIDSEEFHLTLDRTKADYTITNNNGKFLFGIISGENNTLSKPFTLVLFLLYILVYLFIALGINSVYQNNKFPVKNTIVLWFFLFFDLLILRFADYYFHFPFVLKETFLFSPYQEMPPGLNSPGDQIITGILVLFLAVNLFRNFNFNISSLKINKLRILLIIWDLALWVVSFLIFVYLFQLIQNLPFNSFFGVEVNGINNFLSLFSILLFSSSLYFIGRALGSHILKIPVPYGLHVFMFILFGSIVFLLYSESFILPLTTTFFVLLLILIIRFSTREQRINVLKYLLVIILFSAAIALIINISEQQKKNLHLKQTAELLSVTHDDKLENKFIRLDKELKQDRHIIKIIDQEVINVESEIKQYVSTKYFPEISKKYDIQVTLCQKGELLEIQPEGIVSDCSGYFEKLISEFGTGTKSPILYLLNSDPESIYYIAKLTYPDKNDPSGFVNIYLEFYYKFIPEGIGYPELLANRTNNNLDLSNYSYARYHKDILIYKFGSFPYHTNLKYLAKYPEKQFFHIDRYLHYKLKMANGDYLVVSRPYTKLSVQLLSFSVLFFVFAITIVMVLMFLYSKDVPKLLRSSFQTRLQLIFISTISFIIIILAVITLYYVKQSNENKLIEQLNEKTNSVIIELQHKIGGGQNLNTIDQPQLEKILLKFSKVFFTDINLYSPSGQLIASSRPEIFNLGLLSENINPMAYEEIMVKSRLFYFTQEKIGKVSYYSSYAPLELGGDNTAGIVNLPYFAKQTEVKQAYYLMIFTFINLFVFLGIIGTVIAVAFSRIITRPLKVLQENIASIQIDKPNKPIQWANEDEIGKLITEYNKMIDKLEHSAELLKQSERESAWREVAQQIAHEIKNPLTPMKLNVQYLDKAFREKDPDLDEKVKSISNSLISQIESLDKVAEMFSDLAKTRVRNFENVDLGKVIRESVQLFKNNTPVDISYQPADITERYFTLAFEKDLLRLFNNLIKNAIQAIEKNKKGTVNISLEAKDQFIIVTISDNGKGIDDEQKSKIFQPYFTTRSTGTGLGLAIVKNIVQEIGGEISFESQKDNGTVFTLKFRNLDAG